jgi:hypothetical protein
MVEDGGEDNGHETSNMLDGNEDGHVERRQRGAV